MITNDLFDCGDRDSIKFELIPIVAAVNNLLDSFFVIIPISSRYCFRRQRGRYAADLWLIDYNLPYIFSLLVIQIQTEGVNIGKCSLGSFTNGGLACQRAMMIELKQKPFMSCRLDPL